MDRFARVAVHRPLFRLLHYRVPEHLLDEARPGVRCVVPLGRSRVDGFVVALDPEAEVGGVRDLLEVLDPDPVLPPDLVELGLWMARYYQHYPGETLARMLPPRLRARARPVYRAAGSEPAVGGEARRLWEQACRPEGLRADRLGPAQARLVAELVSTGALVRGWAVEVGEAPAEVWFGLAAGAPPPSQVARRAPRMAEALSCLAEGPLPRWALRQRGVGAEVLGRLVAKGWVARFDRTQTPGSAGTWAVAQGSERPVPTSEQADALVRVREALDERAFRPIVLQGVTGSGKTEVYLRAAEETLARGRGVLFLVPEIGLTPQFLGRVCARFADRVAVLHSGLGEGERALQWERLRRGEVAMALGARSAVFAPLADLGLVVVDEEHEPAYKQEEGLRYHAKHVALYRARQAGAVAILGSATPDVESLWLCRTNRYTLCRLPRRVGAAGPPRIRVVDLRQEDRRRGRRTLISEPLAGAVEGALARREQALLFLNRRGFSPALVCGACGEALRCSRCAVGLTFHRRPGGGVLLCHYCGARRPVPAACPACEAPGLSPVGAGTQRLLEAVRARWPEARVARFDRDVVRRDGGRSVLVAFERGEVDVLVGTQMLAKGHHFPRLTVVGVVDADLGLHFPDFRASERTFQLLVQVAGRAGREDRPGVAYVQTRSPEHPVFRAVQTGDHDAFAQAELEARREAGYPPFRRLALALVSGKDREAAERGAAGLARRASAEGRRWEVEVLGPAPAPLEQLRGRWRFQVLLRAPASDPRPLTALLGRLRALGAMDPLGDVRVSLDMDPVSML
ncbi:replication restart helicase PriA [Deferrisoma camini]|uniref:replication restart helicase PriA n=1 Tax=Deferrisoma camini TaxID=1035120 RepID=UPI00046D57F4|nr:primosomal protein N' [Deferrisoma camini]